MPSIQQNTLDNKRDTRELILSKLTFHNDEHRTINPTTDGNLVVRLHNVDHRPTTYTLNIKTCRYGKVSSFVIDTIINEIDKEHEMLKVSWPATSDGLSHIVNTLQRLINQSAKGTASNTHERYESIGLLYRRREAA